MPSLNKDKLATDVQDCTACGACLASCPTASIAMSEDSEGFMRPYISESTCIGCQKCLKVCPILNHKQATVDDIVLPRTYAAVHKDSSILKKSSSGGAFTAIAEYVLNQGGIVCGAVYDEKFRVTHTITDTFDGLQAMRGSKYAPGHAYTVYKSIAEHLKNNCYVLFTGLPCQIVGLKSYLGSLASSPYLITCDIICHGMVSDFLYRSFLSYLSSEQKNAAISSINFRQKTSQGTVLRVTYSNRVVKDIPHEKNFYYKMMLSDTCLRHSCYNCIAKDLPRQADFTIGDFWGIKTPLMPLDKAAGISVLFAHNLRAQQIISNLTDTLNLIPTSFSTAVYENISFWVSPIKDNSRSRFIDYLLKHGYKHTVRRYYKYPNLRRFFIFIKKHINFLSR